MMGWLLVGGEGANVPLKHRRKDKKQTGRSAAYEADRGGEAEGSVMLEGRVGGHAPSRQLWAA